MEIITTLDPGFMLLASGIPSFEGKRPSSDGSRTKRELLRSHFDP